jgi:hypothetical protein
MRSYTIRLEPKRKRDVYKFWGCSIGDWNHQRFDRSHLDHPTNSRGLEAEYIFSKEMAPHPHVHGWWSVSGFVRGELGKHWLKATAQPLLVSFASSTCVNSNLTTPPVSTQKGLHFRFSV